MPVSGKKIEQRVIPKEISKENYRESEPKFKPDPTPQEAVPEGQGYQKYNYEEARVHQQDHPDRIRHDNLVGQSLPNFNPGIDSREQKDARNNVSVLNQSFTERDMRPAQYLIPSTHYSGQHSTLNKSQNANMFEQRDRTLGSTAFHNKPKNNSGIKSLKDNHRKVRREFFPSNRKKRGGMNFGKNSGKNQSSEINRGSEDQKRPQWGLKVDKIKPSVGKLRKPDFLKNPSSDIMISGINSRELSSYLHQELQKIGEIIELRMKWLNSGDMQVKFAHPDSAKKAMDLFDGIYLWGTKLKVTQILQLNTAFKPKIGRFFNKSNLLPQIKENEESSDGEKVSSSENDKYSPNSIMENEIDTLELIKKNITDLIDNEDPQDQVNSQEDSNNGSLNNANTMGMEYNQQTAENWEDDQRYYEQEDFGDNSQGRNQIPGQLYPTMSSSSGGMIDHNISSSEDGKGIEFFNRTQSVRMFNPINSGISSLMNNSYESGGRVEENDLCRSSRSYYSRSSRESNPMYTSACERTFASSGGMMDHNNSGMQPDLQQPMHSSFDLRDDSLNQYNTLTPRLRSDFSFGSGPNYHPGEQFCDPNHFSSTWTEPYHPVNYGGHPGMSTSYSMASLDHQKSFSNPGEKEQQLSFDSSVRFQKNKKWIHNKFHPNKKMQSVQERDGGQYTININDIIDRRDTRTTLMIKNIPNKYSMKQLLYEVNQNNKDRFNFLYVPIDVQNNCNVGYAFINFLNSAYILDFYEEYNDKGWDSYNSEKVCQIKYGRLQGRKKLISHFENTKVIKNKDRNVKPWISNKEEVDREEINQILEEYKRRRAVERGNRLKTRPTEPNLPKEKAKEDTKVKDIDKKNILKKLLEKSGEDKKEDTKAKHNVSSKRNSQKPADSKPKLDEETHGKRPSSDDEMKKGKVKKADQNKALLKAFKVNLKNISKKSQENN